MFKKILIVGCGLIGSSILRATIKKKISRKVYVLEKSKNHIRQIRKLRLNCEILKDTKKQIPNVDMIIVCTHISEYLKIFNKIEKYINKNTIVTDVGSAKGKIYREIKTKIKKNISWISSHPIAGSEASGPKFGNEKLFSNKWCVLIRDKNANKKHIQILSKFWTKIGSNIVYMNLKEHDHIFSITSHIPHLVAYNMVKTAVNFEKKKKSNIVKFSAGGLRDFTRTAASNEIMWKDIFLNNHKNINKGIELFIDNLRQIKKLINKKNEKQLIKIMQESKKIRKKIVSSKQDVSLPDFGRR
tara:strand:+ start:190 stop:1089 length:900 start_codon:yes stop_codon:yes gene_type:complete